MAREVRKRISDVGALRALADPVRYRLLGHLMAVGPQTATQCAEVVGATPSNCSYHLRELARYGLVERAAAGAEDGRERPWRPTATGFSYGRPGDEPADAVAALADRQLRHVGIDDEAALAHAAAEEYETLSPEWRKATTMSTYGLRVTASELTELTEAIDRLIRPYIAPTREGAPPGARTVHIGFSAFRGPAS
ncbi:MAG: ArsR/SmtB family transcription factor [Actinomadura sp.]